MEKNKWSISLMSLWIIITLLVPIGLIMGPVNLKYSERRGQAVWLLILGFVSLVLWIIHFTGIHSH